MIVFAMAGCPHDTDVLMWDVIEQEWRIGCLRVLIEGVDAHPAACTMREADDLIECDNPVPVFENASHWCALPLPVGVFE